MKLFLSSVGGNHPIAFCLVFLLGLLLTDFGIMFQTYFLGYWGSQYTERDPAGVDPLLYVAYLDSHRDRVLSSSITAILEGIPSSS